MNTAQLDRIRIFPIKSLDYVEMESCDVGFHSLLHDRSFAMMGDDGRYVNGKRTGRVNELKARYDLGNGFVYLSERSGGEESRFELDSNNKELIQYLSDFFGMGIMLVGSEKGELMDVPARSSVTVISEASIASLQDQLPHYPLEDLRMRFRANLEFTGVDAFWEEQLFAEPGTGIRFRVGNVEMIGVSPRARCNVPPRDPLTGNTDKEFVKRMMQSRKDSLLEGSHLLSYGNLYHLSVDTYVPPSQQGKKLHLGDKVELLGQIALP